MKTLKESILTESILTSIGQGDKYFEELYKKYRLDPKKITRNKDGSINYDGNVNFDNNDFTKLPFKFNKVEGSFYCRCCNNLKSLEGSPEYVDGNFCCAGCEKLTSLEGCPKQVGGIMFCCNCEKLKTLEYSPKIIGNEFNLAGCKNLKSLKGITQDVANVTVTHCDSLLSLEGLPNILKGSLLTISCYSLKTLEGCPKEIGRYFDCSYCTDIKQLDGIPTKVGRDFICIGCDPKVFNEFYIDQYCEVKGDIKTR